MSIINLLNQIKNEEIVLPSIQRDFVWPKEKITALLDSIMRDYPIGIVLLWETYLDIQYRTFIKDYKPGNRYTFFNNSLQQKKKLVLDGQQRLQSLYISLYSTYEGKFLYFDILSGQETDDFKEEKYLFDFLTEKEVVERNSKSKQNLQKTYNEDNNGISYFVKVKDIFSMTAKEKQKFRKNITKELNLTDDDDLRFETNFSVFDEVLIKDDNILKTSIIDENKPSESPERKSEADVLEVFVRINRQGTPLNRSDLLFSMIKLNWKESANALPEFVDEINEGNSFELNTDFIIRCLFAVSDLGTKFDINVLRKKSNMEKIRNNFKPCCDAIRSTVDFVQKECWCSSSKVIGGYNNLIPLVYYLFHTKNHQVSNNQIVDVRKSLFLFGFTSPFSRYADSRLAKFIRQELKSRIDENDYGYPFKDCVWWINYWENVDCFGEDLLQGNILLTHHLIQHIFGAKIHYKKNSPEIDHIFPRSVLRQKEFNEEEINHFANFWILGKNQNQNKNNKSPKEYFKDVSDLELEKAFIDRKLLNYKQYKTFLKTRSKKIMDHIKKELDFNDDDFDLYEDDVILCEVEEIES